MKKKTSVGCLDYNAEVSAKVLTLKFPGEKSPKLIKTDISEQPPSKKLSFNGELSTAFVNSKNVNIKPDLISQSTTKTTT